jgi:hypothetical protein
MPIRWGILLLTAVLGSGTIAACGNPTVAANPQLSNRASGLASVVRTKQHFATVSPPCDGGVGNAPEERRLLMEQGSTETATRPDPSGAACPRAVPPGILLKGQR